LTTKHHRAASRRRRRARKGEGTKLRGEILDAAEALLVARGSPDHVSMRAIAERVGVSPPAIYMHFADKDELFFECCSRRFGEMAVQLAQAAEGHPEPVAKIRAIGRAYVEFGLALGEHYEVMMLGSPPDDLVLDDPMRLPGASALVFTAQVVEEGMTTGTFRSDLDPLATAVALWAAVHGTVLVLLGKRKHPVKLFEDEEAVIDQLLDILASGLVAG
jgi:AcrR family transcriptional regulator